MGVRHRTPIACFSEERGMDGTEIRIARIRAGLKQYQLAQRADVREVELSLIENNRRQPTPDKLARIQAALREVADARAI
jgi:transcriptional regulator with XRE-family HTH domain